MMWWHLCVHVCGDGTSVQGRMMWWHLCVHVCGDGTSV